MLPEDAFCEYLVSISTFLLGNQGPVTHLLASLGLRMQAPTLELALSLVVNMRRLFLPAASLFQARRAATGVPRS